MSTRSFALSFFWLLSFTTVFAQQGGVGAYSFLNLTITPRSASLGSKVVALDESDAGVALNNPAHLNSALHNHLSLSYVRYLADISYGYVSYARHYSGIGTFGVGLQHVGYGQFTEADPTGQITGSFTGYDMAFHLMYSRSFDSLFTVGVNVKPVFSHLESYRSFGIAADIGLEYANREHLFAAGIVVRNIGTMLKTYTPGIREPLPLELVAGFSQKLRHAPFRFVVSFQQLQNLDMYYRRQREYFTFFADNEQDKQSTFEQIGNEFISHVILGVEFVPVRNFYLRGGYNYQRRNELKIEERTSMVGFSWGIGVKINKYHISYGRATYHLAGASNHFSVSTNLDDFFHKSNL
ncbi:MAG TPA: type IX secretion system protein PorQ [Tenuifilaceae bacterium]|nr:type IX secretion system protein PorQ [Tenuifilaceae bacterium]